AGLPADEEAEEGVDWGEAAGCSDAEGGVDEPASEAGAPGEPAAVHTVPAAPVGAAGAEAEPVVVVSSDDEHVSAKPVVLGAWRTARRRAGATGAYDMPSGAEGVLLGGGLLPAPGGSCSSTAAPPPTREDEGAAHCPPGVRLLERGELRG
ncbi:unnamed protein product, partial [Prorocentrum cordatum]